MLIFKIDIFKNREKDSVDISRLINESRKIETLGKI